MSGQGVDSSVVGHVGGGSVGGHIGHVGGGSVGGHIGHVGGGSIGGHIGHVGGGSVGGHIGHEISGGQVMQEFPGIGKYRMQCVHYNYSDSPVYCIRLLYGPGPADVLART